MQCTYVSAETFLSPLERLVEPNVASWCSGSSFLRVSTCVKHGDSSRCCTKYPHLAPAGHPAHARMDIGGVNNKSFVANNPPAPADNTQHNNLFLLNSPVTHNVALHSHGISVAMSRHWLIDSGCNSHVPFDRLAFTECYKLTSPSTMDLGANSNTPIMGRGDVTLTLSLNVKPIKCLIRNVLHVPALRYQLLSVSAIAKWHIETSFSESVVSLHRHSDFKILASGTLTKGLHILDTTPNTTKRPLPQHQKLRYLSPPMSATNASHMLICWAFDPWLLVGW